MPKLIALETGYYANKIRHAGEEFFFSDIEWKDEAARPRWAQPVDGEETHVSEDVKIPKNWRKLKPEQRIELAARVGGTTFTSDLDADKVIAAYLGEPLEPEPSKPAGKAKTDAPAKPKGTTDAPPAPQKSHADEANDAAGIDDDWLPPGTEQQGADDVAKSAANAGRAGRAGKRS